MTEKLVQELNDLELKILSLKKENSELKKINKYLENSLSIKEDKFIQKEKLYKEIEEQNRRLKVVNALSGSEEYKKVMKLQMNRLIKEMDICISDLKGF